MRTPFGVRGFVRFAGIVAVSALACAAATAVAPPEARAQMAQGEYWLYQPQQGAPVGRAWANSDRSVEYWAYVVGEYEFADVTNVPANPWHLDLQRIGTGAYANFAAFKAAILAMPMMSGKTILFQSHVVTEETVEND
jgi:hypothetical protein